MMVINNDTNPRQSKTQEQKEDGESVRGMLTFEVIFYQVISAKKTLFRSELYSGSLVIY
jgi:hypothetical protein